LLLTFCVVLSSHYSFAQDGFFSTLSSAQARVASSELPNVEKFKLYQLKTTALRNYLAVAPLETRSAVSRLRLAIPLPDGTTEMFLMAESPILAPAVAAQHPEIKTYTGKGITHPTYTIRLSFTSTGFDAIVLGLTTGTAYITKVSRDSGDQRYATYSALDVKKNDSAKAFGNFGKCGTLSPAIEALPEKSGAKARVGAATSSTGTTLRTFRLAIAANKEFTKLKGNDDINASFNAVVGYVNRMNAVYRQELSVAFTLVSGTNTIFNSTNDPGYVNSDHTSMLAKNQSVLDGIIGNANYDVGHVLGSSGTGSSGGGIAQGSSACQPESKAKGVTAMGDLAFFAPVFDDQTLSHEVGHQFSMDHTFNSSIPVCTTREAKTSVEPGSGTTIMSYGYTCSVSNDPTKNDDYETPQYQPFLHFHTVSYQQAVNYINTLSCFTSTPLANTAPVISSFPTNITIPKSTPFELSATASDANTSDNLTYSWEGIDIGTEVPDATVLANTAKPPFFRSYAPVATGKRTYPRLAAILNGSNYAKGDKLPSIGITTNHTLTVRDNVGGVTFQSMTVTIDGNSGPFLETTNLSGTYPAKSSQTITWSVANTTAPPVNCSNVTILLSTDGGQTFPVTLLADTPNDGSEAIILPDVRTSQARIKIASSNNVFFDISNSNFTINEPLPVATPIVKVNSTDPTGSEGGSNAGARLAARQARLGTASDPGFIRFERSNTQGALVVNYEIGGTAKNGVDFATLPTSVTFADGQSVYTEEMDPIEDDIIEGDETIIITLIDEDDYDLDPNEKTTTLTIKDNDLPATIFAIASVSSVDCQTISAGLRRISFTPKYTGQTGQPISFSVANEMLPTTAAGPYTLSLYTDNPIITLKAVQAGSPTEASFAYNWLAGCGTPVVVPPVSATFSITGVTPVNCQTIAGGLRQVSFTPQYAGQTGQPISFSVANEMLPTTAAGPYTLSLYTDNSIITLKAVQTGSPVEASFSYNWLANCGNNVATRLTATSLPESTLSVRVLGNPVTNGQASVEIRGAASQSLRLQLIDARGRIITSHSVEQSGIVEQHTFDISRHPVGTLILRASTPTQSKSVSLLKAD
jgi:hypothetical protein